MSTCSDSDMITNTVGVKAPLNTYCIETINKTSGWWWRNLRCIGHYLIKAVINYSGKRVPYLP